MNEFVLGMAGSMAGMAMSALIFAVGFGVGRSFGRAEGRSEIDEDDEPAADWIRENACYTCQEKWRYRNQLTDDPM